ncbi:MAG TPA: class I SAM-dependent methyltransferase [Bryobacteraceae bacterium]|nr:class I SAM-dependent methyltransferase [Bryobacteraceae bacterium]
MWRRRASRGRVSPANCSISPCAYRVALILLIGASIIYFPYHTDSPLSSAEQAELTRYYATAYQKADLGAAEKDDSEYVRMAKEGAEKADVLGNIRAFVRHFNLQEKRVLDIGAGRGYLQDVVPDYTGLDISPTAKRFFHKPFVHGSATLMPLKDNDFDGVWTIWVFEHVPNPQAALIELRRVTRDGGLVFLAPQWDCTPWAAEGYPVRPFSDFGWGGKLIKASIPIQDALWKMSRPFVRLALYTRWKLHSKPTTLHYRRITPNYTNYWMADSDAVNRLDQYETALWFLSRGDECLNCRGKFHGLNMPDEPLLIKVHKALAVATN